MRDPIISTPLVQELWTAYIEDIEPRIDALGGPMAMMVRGLKMAYLDLELPGLFEQLDADRELQGMITARVRAVLERIDAETPAADEQNPRSNLGSNEGVYGVAGILSGPPIKNETAAFVRYNADDGAEDPRDLYTEDATDAENENSPSNQE